MDIVERLRKYDIDCHCVETPHSTVIEAADEIERLREALKQIRDFGPMTVDDQRWRIANAALQQKESE